MPIVHCVSTVISKSLTTVNGKGNVKNIKCIIASSLESANSSILAVLRHLKENSGKKNQDFMLIRLNYPSNMIGCGGDMHG